LTAQGVPVVTFDSDLFNSTRAADIGTAQEFMGRTMVRLLRQLVPQGGTFAGVRWKKLQDTGCIEDITKYNNRDDHSHWYLLEQNYTLMENIYDNKHAQGGHMGVMERAVILNPTAMIFFTRTPMRN
jgi:hypothetical protein